jgi:hypothetical protein
MSRMKWGAILAAVSMSLAIPLTAEPASALSLQLAKKCRAMALKAHPYKLPGEKGPGTAAAERQYYSQCVANGGNMPESSTSATPAGNPGPSKSVPPPGSGQTPAPSK